MAGLAGTPVDGQSPQTYGGIFDQNLIFMNSWEGKTLTTYGDSITEQNLWQPKLNSILGFSSMTNLGVGGTMLSGGWAENMTQESRVDAIPESDLIIIMGGANDWGNDVVLGSNTRTNIINSTNLEKIEGSRVDWTTGVIEADATQNTSSFYFELVDGETYTFENISEYSFYNSAKARLDGGVFGVAGKNDVVATSGSGTVKYIRFSYKSDPVTWSPYPCVYIKDIEDTFKPALSLLVSKIRMRYPLMTIVVMGPTFCKNSNKDGGSSPFTDKYGLNNNIGLTTTDYSVALEEASKYIGVPFIDISSLSGWGDENVDLYTADDGANVHPNDAGAIRMANAIAGELTNINPRV